MSSAVAAQSDVTRPLSAKGVRTRARLVTSAKRVFERDGFLTARITDIANDAGVSHGSFYHYFDSKDEIFRVVAEEQEVSLLTLEPATTPEETPIQRIEAANRRYLEAYRAEAKIMRVIEEVSRYDPEVREVRRRRDDEFGRRLQTAIRKLQNAGQADKSLDPRYAANALGGMVAKFAEMWLVQGGDYDMRRSVQQLTRLWANALGLKPE
jgi:AcrR family transcriptional regulator